MRKQANPSWPTWKITAVAIGCAVAGTVFLVAYLYLPAPVQAAATQPAPPMAPGGPIPSDPTRTATSLGLSNMLILMGLIGWGASLMFAGWLAHRMYMRIPAWRRRQWFGSGH